MTGVKELNVEIVCQRCGETYAARIKNAKYCNDCKLIRIAELSSARAKKRWQRIKAMRAEAK